MRNVIRIIGLKECTFLAYNLCMSIDYLEQYRSGKFDAWDKLVQSPEETLNSPDIAEQAVLIAGEIMARVSTNIGILRDTLISSGASLGPEGIPLSEQDLKFLTDKFGRLPLSVEAFYRKVGSIMLTPKTDYQYGRVSLEQKHGVALIALDPLQVYSPTDLKTFVEDYEDNDGEPFNLYLCPDYLHKQNISGGMPYFIELPPVSPEDRLDPLIQGERHSLSFVNYLRYCLKWGGFSGLDICEKKDSDIDLNWRNSFKRVKGSWRVAYQEMLSSLRKNLIDF